MVHEEFLKQFYAENIEIFLESKKKETKNIILKKGIQ